MQTIVPVEVIERKILLIRGQKVMLDADLAEIYGVTTKRLNEQVKRNAERFPADFAFQLTPEEWKTLKAQGNEPNRSQIATSSQKHRDPRFLPWVFTEHGAIMLATVLNSPLAVLASIQIVRVFVRLRQMLASNKELARRLDDLENKYDAQFKIVFDAIRQLMVPPETKKKRIGFGREKD
jgi:hypothetical protein